MCRGYDPADIFKRAHAALKRGDTPSDDLMTLVYRWLDKSETRRTTAELKADLSEPVKTEKVAPQFHGSQTLATVGPTIVTDINGDAYAIDPVAGTYRRIEPS